MRPLYGPGAMGIAVTEQSGRVVVSADGATVLRSLPLDHSQRAVAALVAAVNSQESEYGDGTTGLVVLAGSIAQGLMAEGVLESIGSGVRVARELLELVRCIEHGQDSVAKGSVMEMEPVLNSVLAGKHVDGKGELVQAVAAAMEAVDGDDTRIVLTPVVSGGVACWKDGVVLGGKRARGERSVFSGPGLVAVLTGPLSSREELLRLEAMFERRGKTESDPARRLWLVMCQFGFDETVLEDVGNAKMVFVSWVSAGELDRVIEMTGATPMSQIPGDDSCDDGVIGFCAGLEELPEPGFELSEGIMARSRAVPLEGLVARTGAMLAGDSSGQHAAVSATGSGSAGGIVIRSEEGFRTTASVLVPGRTPADALESLRAAGDVIGVARVLWKTPEVVEAGGTWEKAVAKWMADRGDIGATVSRGVLRCVSLLPGCDAEAGDGSEGSAGWDVVAVRRGALIRALELVAGLGRVSRVVQI